MDVSAIIDGLDQLTKQVIPLEEGDYIGDNGLYYCHICHTPKQCRTPNPFEIGKFDIHNCMCKCRKEEYNRKEIERRCRRMEDEYTRFQQGYAESDFDLLKWINLHDYQISEKLTAERKRILKRMCFREEKMLDWTFENDDRANERVSGIGQKFVENFSMMKDQGKGLLYYGEVGRGKSFYAACIANALIEQGIPVFMTDFTHIANAVHGLFDKRQEYYDNLNRFPLLILDDLSAERKTEYMKEIVYNVVNSRYNAGLPLIITTNLTGEELENPAELSDQRLFSRLYEMCIPVKVEGVDRRAKKLKSDFKSYQSILGF